MPEPAKSNVSAPTSAALKSLISTNEEWLMERILHYATLHDFTRYTSTLKEAWRASIEGLSASLLAALDVHKAVPEFGPEEDWLNDPCSEFGRQQAEKHRNRGITLAMFLGLMKYYRQCYLDLLCQSEFSADRGWAELFIHRFFDRVEISFSQSWSGVDTDGLTNNLQQQNRFLANEKNKFLTLFESYSMPCFLVTNCGYLDCMNLSATRVFGYGLSSGEHYYRAEKDERVPDWLFAELATFSEGQEKEVVFEKQYPDEKAEKTFVVHFKQMLDVSGKYSGIVVSLADVTLRIRDKQQLEKAHTELKNAQEQMLQREKLASIGRLATGMAHEINNPLAAMLQNLQVVVQRLQPDFKRNLTVASECGLDMAALDTYLQRQQVGKMHQAIKDAGSRAASIVKKVSSLNHTSNAEPILVDLRRLLDNALLLMQSEDESCRRQAFSGVKITREYVENLPDIRCHELELQQVLVDIICNAVLAMDSEPEGLKRGRCLILRAGQEGQLVMLEIEDNGPGMTETECQKIFDPFYTTREPGEGLGLGLTMAYKIVQRYEGQIAVESSPGVGSKFIIKLPAAKADCVE